MKGKFPNNLKNIMDKKGLGSTALGRLVNDTKQNISRYRDESRKLPVDLAMRIADVLDCRPEEILLPQQSLAPIVGRVGANADGTLLYGQGQQSYTDFAPIPPGGTKKAVALEVVGDSMRGFADDGSLIYFEDQREKPTESMLNQIVVVELDTDEVLIKRLLKGREEDLYDLESINGPMRYGVRIRWAAHITAIIPPHTAQKVIVRE